MNKLKYLIFKLKLKYNKIKNKQRFLNFEKTDKYLLVKKKFDTRFLYLVPKMKGIIIELGKNNIQDIELIKFIASYYYDKEIIIKERTRIFSNNDIKELYYINRNIILDNVYIANRNILAKNEIYTCDIKTYILILEKIEHLISICKEHYKTEEEQIIFIIAQIAKHIKYVDYHDYRTCLANALLLGTGVCMDFAITLFKCIEDLGYECEIITGVGAGSKEDVGSTVNITKKSHHAWNQIKISNKWYNIDLTWYLNTKDTKWLLVSDEEFEKDYKHLTNTKEHYCRESFDREKLNKILNEVNAQDISF